MKTEFSAEKIMSLHVQIAPPYDTGTNEDGHLRVIPITGGTFEGENFNGKIIPGGADWNTEIGDGYTHVLAHYCIQENDGTLISVENEGYINFDQDSVARTVPRFTTDFSNGKYGIFRTGVFIGTLDATHSDDGRIEIVIYKLD